MSSLQQRLIAITDMQLGAITAAADLKSRLSELEGLRERVREALEIAVPETRSVTAATPVPIWDAAINLPAASV